MKTEKITHTNEETEYRYYDKSGDASLTVCHVFDGVDIIFNSVHMNVCDLAAETSGRLLEIHHCREGRLEHQHGDELVYMTPGDLAISRRRESEDICRFPLRHYHGITIVINEDTAPKCFSCLLKDVNVQPTKVADKLCGDNGCFVIRSQEYIEHLFSELYSVPVKNRKAYYKVKILELLLVLSWTDPDDTLERPPGHGQAMEHDDGPFVFTAKFVDAHRSSPFLSAPLYRIQLPIPAQIKPASGQTSNGHSTQCSGMASVSIHFFVFQASQCSVPEIIMRSFILERNSQSRPKKSPRLINIISTYAVQKRFQKPFTPAKYALKTA